MNSPENILAQYRRARAYKASLGKCGICEQAEMNERFYIGDQWHGADCGAGKPLVRHNVIKRIGDYKISRLGGADVNVTYFAEGLTVSRKNQNTIRCEKQKICNGGKNIFSPLNSENDNALMLSALNSYRMTVADRVKLNNLSDAVLRDAYIRGTGVLYTYFDPNVKTGLFADYAGGTPILGDIVCERIKIDDVYFGDPTCEDIQKQPYIILAEERTSEDIAAQAGLYGVAEEYCRRTEALGAKKQKVFTKLYKKTEASGRSVVYATKVTEDAVIRPPFCMGISRYPISVFIWEPRDNCAYGDSEVTYLIPNQIAINRMITAGVWSAMSAGMPLMVVNGDVVNGEITNEPGQIIRAYGTSDEITSAVKFITPPDYSSGYNEAVKNLISNTLTQSGANEAALGDMSAENTSAIIELRKTAWQYLTPLKNRYLAFVEDVSLVWAEFFLHMYGKRCLKISDDDGVWYFPFDASKYADLVLSAKATVGDNVYENEKERQELLDELFSRGVITPLQYIKRLPRGALADKELLISELEKKENDNERIQRTD